jgi:hypothetical protein
MTSCRSRLIPVDCVSFAAHKRHLALFPMGNLLRAAFRLKTRRVRSASEPTPAAMRVGRPEITAIRALQVHQRPLIAQQVLPVRVAVSAVPAITTFGAVIAARAGQPSAAAAVGGRINR